MTKSMMRSGRKAAAVVAVVAVAMSLTACGTSSPSTTPKASPAGEPVAGGTLTALQISEPRNLDPAVLLNASQGNALLGNALYGNLMTSDAVTGETVYSLATDFSTEDDGKTFTLTLQDDVTFSDGSPLTADAVKFNWDRLKDETLASNTLNDAQTIKATTVVDDATLLVELATPVPFFATQIIESSLNWIAEPTALQQDAAAFDASPIGAGPFTLESWTRGGAIDLVKNDTYWDAPRPYLDALTINTSSNSQQRVNAVSTGDADLASENDWIAVDKANAADLQVTIQPQAGGQFLSLNMRRAPFDNADARKAVSSAIDIAALNVAMFGSDDQSADTLFPKNSPFYNDVSLHTYDPEGAQKLFDKLAAAGTPVEFAFTVFTGSEKLGEAVQAQLSAYENVTATIDVVDWSETGRIFGKDHDFDMALQASNFVDPEPVLYNAFYSTARRNAAGIADEKLDAALDAGRFAATLDERVAAYEEVSDRLAELNPVVFYVRAAQVAIATSAVGGIELYGRGSVLPDRLWIQQ